MIRLYRIQDGRQIEALTIPAAVSHRDALAFSPDGQSLAAGLDDTTIPIWDVSRCPLMRGCGLHRTRFSDLDSFRTRR